MIEFQMNPLESLRLFKRSKDEGREIFLMLRTLYKSKIHRATITQTELDYEGSITIDAKLMEAADILAGEKLEVFNLNNGARFSTYAIEGKRNSGIICVNGAAARLAQVGDKVIIISYVLLTEEEVKSLKPKIIFVDDKNRLQKG